jgi:flagellar protein FlbD
MEDHVITLHRLNGDEMTLNADLILTIEATPDTHIIMMDRRQILVLESVEEVVEAAIEYRRLVVVGGHLPGVPA